MKYSFKYHGTVNGQTLFSIITDDESGQGLAGIDICHHHFKADPQFNITAVSYMDIDLTKCHTSTHRSNGVVEHSLANQVTEEQTLNLIKRLTELDVELKKIGNISKLPLRIIKVYPFKLTYSSGKVSYKYYHGVDEEDAASKARFNNQAAVSIEIHDGEMLGSLN